jgi:hypothetical protein
MTSPVSRGGKSLRFRWDSPSRRLEDNLSELADYKIKGTVFTETTAKTPSWLSGSQLKGLNTGCTERKASLV